nr:homeobox protein 2-like isoform X3 [Ipomoea batatas]GMD27687.1 homeobox protein 2-like isoform X3 [Ipomoea batatas]
MTNLVGAFAFLVLAVTSCLFQTEATRPGQFITITSSSALAPTTSKISFPPASLSTAASALGPAIGDISFPSPPMSALGSAPEIGFPVDSTATPGPAVAHGKRHQNSFNYNFNNNGGFSHRHFVKHNGYTVPKRQGMSDTRFMDNGKYYNGYSERYYSKGNSYNIPERQGISDTKFTKNDNYYNDVNDNNKNGKTISFSYSLEISRANSERRRANRRVIEEAISTLPPPLVFALTEGF